MSVERSHLRVTMRHHDDARVKGPLMLVRGQQLAIFRTEFQKSWSATTAEFPRLTGKGDHFVRHARCSSVLGLTGTEPRYGSQRSSFRFLLQETGAMQEIG